MPKQALIFCETGQHTEALVDAHFNLVVELIRSTCDDDSIAFYTLRHSLGKRWKRLQRALRRARTAEIIENSSLRLLSVLIDEYPHHNRALPVGADSGQVNRQIQLALATPLVPIASEVEASHLSAFGQKRTRS